MAAKSLSDTGAAMDVHQGRSKENVGTAGLRPRRGKGCCRGSKHLARQTSAMIGGEDHDGVVPAPTPLQFRKKPSELMVEICNRFIVLVDRGLPYRRWPVACRIAFVQPFDQFVRARRGKPRVEWGWWLIRTVCVDVVQEYEVWPCVLTPIDPPEELIIDILGTLSHQLASNKPTAGEIATQ